MKILTVLFKTQQKSIRPIQKESREDKDQLESLVTIGREQFKKLVDLGLSVPVAHL